MAAVYSRQPENVPCRLFPLLILLLTLAYVWSRIHPTAAFVTLFTIVYIVETESSHLQHRVVVIARRHSGEIGSLFIVSFN